MKRTSSPSFGGHFFMSEGLGATPVLFDPNDPSGAVLDPPEGIIIPVVPEPPAPDAPVPPAPSTLTVEDLERARREERDKLYPQLKGLQDEVSKFRTAAEEQAAAAKSESDRLAAEAEERRLSELSALERVAEVEKNFEEKLRELTDRNAQQEALLAQERRYNELVTYRHERLNSEEVANTIAPQFLDYIWGENEAEIDAAITTAQQKTASILEEVSAAQQQFRQQQKGVTATAPPNGPLENLQTYETVTADDLRNMDMATYSKKRNQLLGGASALARNRGLYD